MGAKTSKEPVCKFCSRSKCVCGPYESSVKVATSTNTAIASQHLSPSPLEKVRGAARSKEPHLSSIRPHQYLSEGLEGDQTQDDNLFTSFDSSNFSSSSLSLSLSPSSPPSRSRSSSGCSIGVGSTVSNTTSSNDINYSKKEQITPPSSKQQDQSGTRISSSSPERKAPAITQETTFDHKWQHKQHQQHYRHHHQLRKTTTTTTLNRQLDNNINGIKHHKQQNQQQQQQQHKLFHTNQHHRLDLIGAQLRDLPLVNISSKGISDNNSHRQLRNQLKQQKQNGKANKIAQTTNKTNQILLNNKHNYHHNRCINCLLKEQEDSRSKEGELKVCSTFNNTGHHLHIDHQQPNAISTSHSLVCPNCSSEFDCHWLLHIKLEHNHQLASQPTEQHKRLLTDESFATLNLTHDHPISEQSTSNSETFQQQQQQPNEPEEQTDIMGSHKQEHQSDHQSEHGWALVHKGQHKGLAYSQEERKKLGILGLIPPAYQSQDLQVEQVMNFIESFGDELNKYIYLRHLKDFNERLFYKTLTQNVEKLMPIVYTPVVGLACQKFSHIYMRPRGLYITINDLGQVGQIMANWPEKDVRTIVVTDGERILGLGDLGANGMGISIGKLSLYTALAGIPPQNVLPITLDVGTNNPANLQDPFYIGLKQQRVRGAKYDQLVEEFMREVVQRWGRSCLIQFEDFGNSTAFDLLQRYRSRYCTFNDDIQGTASVCLSGLFSAARVTNTRMGDHNYLFYGAGEANLGTAQLLVMAMIEYGVKEADAKKKIWLVDSRGLVVKNRDGPPLSGHKAHFVHDAPHLKDLEEIIDFVKPTALIGASAQGGSFNEAICRKMAKLNERPIIFALSNPTSKAECTAEQAYQWTEGRCVFASGSPFDPVQYGGKTYVTGQGNNAYIFPGVGLAVIAARVHTIPEETFLVAAKALSDQLTESDIEVGLVYPRLNKIRDVTLKVAARVFHYFYAERLANHRPEPQDKLSYLKNIQYDYDYGSTPSLAKMSLDGATKNHHDQQTINKNGSSLFRASK